MFSQIPSLRRKLTTLAVALVLAIGILAPSKASADSQVTCAPNLIEYLETQLIVQCNSVNYYAQSAARTAGCPVKAIDTLKFWQTLGDSALLAGKNVQVYFTSCGGFNFISALDLIK